MIGVVGSPNDSLERVTDHAGNRAYVRREICSRPADDLDAVPGKPPDELLVHDRLRRRSYRRTDRRNPGPAQHRDAHRRRSSLALTTLLSARSGASSLRARPFERERAQRQRRGCRAAPRWRSPPIRRREWPGPSAACVAANERVAGAGAVAARTNRKQRAARLHAGTRSGRYHGPRQS